MASMGIDNVILGGYVACGAILLLFLLALGALTVIVAVLCARIKKYKRQCEFYSIFWCI